MQNRVPAKREERPPLPAFTPVPRKTARHDGWTPERQRAFIEALADSGSVTRAAGMVNMAQANCYTLRRAPGAESFRAAWDAALDYGGLAGRDAEEEDPDSPFVRVPPGALEWRGELEPAVELEDWEPFIEGEVPWEQAGAEAAEPEGVEEPEEDVKGLPTRGSGPG